MSNACTPILVGVASPVLEKKKPEQNRAACMHSCMHCKTILSSPSALLSGLDHFYNGFEVSFDL